MFYFILYVVCVYLGISFAYEIQIDYTQAYLL